MLMKRWLFCGKGADEQGRIRHSPSYLWCVRLVVDRVKKWVCDV